MPAPDGAEPRLTERTHHGAGNMTRQEYLGTRRSRHLDPPTNLMPAHKNQFQELAC
jgi:hypothetical protein